MRMPVDVPPVSQTQFVYAIELLSPLLSMLKKNKTTSTKPQTIEIGKAAAMETSSVPDVDVSRMEVPRDLVLSKVNCSVATTPLPATSMKAFVPFYQQPKHQPFIARSAWKVAFNGIKALKRLKLSLKDRVASPSLRSDLIVASGHKGKLMLWNADKLSSINMTREHGSGVVTQLIVTNTKVISIVEKDASGHYGASSSGGGNDADIYIWDMNTMQLDTTLSGHDDRVTCIAVSAENECHILSGSQDKTILEWMLPSPNPIARYVGHTSSVTQIAFVFGKYFMSGGFDSTLKLWESDVKDSPRVEVSPTARPPRRPRNMSTTRLAEGALQRTASAKAMRFAAMREGHATCILEGHMGQITFLESMTFASEGSEQGRPNAGSSSSSPPQADSTALERCVKMITACNGGVVRCYSMTFAFKEGGSSASDFSTSLKGSSAAGLPRTSYTLVDAPLLLWSNKAHRALVKDVCWDGHVIVSGSLSDGLSFYNTAASVTNKIVVGTGVRHLAIDTMRRLVVAGCENGQLQFYNYNVFYGLGQHDHFFYKSKQEGANDDTVVLVATFQPHVANVTGMLLERTINGQWERLISTSSDSTFFVMDFDIHRDSRSYAVSAASGNAALTRLLPTAIPPSITYPQLLSHLFTPIADCGSFLFGGVNGGLFEGVWDIISMSKRGGSGKSTVYLTSETGTPLAIDAAASAGGWDASRLLATTVGTMAGSAAKALSRQTTPPPDALQKAIQSQSRVTCCTYYSALKKAVVGCEKGTLRVHPVQIGAAAASASMPDLTDGPGSPQRVFANPNDHTSTAGLSNRKEETILPSIGPPIAFEGGMFPRLVSEDCVDSVVACCLERGSGAGTNRIGGVALVDLNSERQITTTFVFSSVPISVQLFGYPSPKNKYVTAYSLLVQLRTGQLVVLGGSSDSQTLSQHRVVQKEQFTYYPEREADTPMPMPVFASLNTSYNPPRLNVLCIEKGCVLKSEVVPTTAAPLSSSLSSDATSGSEAIIHQCAVPFFDSLNLTANLSEAVQIVAWAPMRLSGYLAAVALQNGIVTILTEDVEKDKVGGNDSQNADAATKPEILRAYRPFDIYPNGAVADHVLERNTRRQRRCYTQMNAFASANASNATGEGSALQRRASTLSTAPTAVTCTVISVSPHARLLALGYSDGVIQLWDFATRRVCRRIYAHCSNPSSSVTLGVNRPILHVSIFSREQKLVSITDCGIRFDTLYGRNVSEPIDASVSESLVIDGAGK